MRRLRCRALPALALAVQCGLSSVAATQAVGQASGGQTSGGQAGAPQADGPAQARPDGASASAAAIIVFDGSGSMWGRIEGGRGAKLPVAREAVDAGLAAVPPSAEVGLVSTGQRGGGSCSDSDLLVPLGRDGRAALAEPLEKLNPKGRGPIVDAVRLAARTLGARRPASIILIHDDADNCQKDACEAAREIAQTQPGLKIHVISLATKREDLAQVTCLAAATGGRHFDAADADAAQAGITTALKMALAGAPAAAPAPTSATPAAGAPANAPRPTAARRPLAPLTGPPGLRLSAHLESGGDPIGVPVGWRVTRAGSSTGEALFEATAPEARVDLAPGSYAVTATVGLVSATQTFVIPASGPVRAAVTLVAGGLKLVARAQKDGPPIDRVTYTVRAAAAGADLKTAAQGEIRWLGRDPVEPLLLAPGTYYLRAERGFAAAERLVTVPVGSQGTADLTLGAGLLTLKSAAQEGGPAFATALFVVSEDDPESPNGRREVARSAAPAPDFVLPAGTYHILVRIGPAEVREQVALGAGESVTRTILVGMGRVEINATLETPRTGGVSRDAIGFQVIALDGGAREVGRFSTTPQTLELPAGNYRIDAQIGGQNVRATQRVSLSAGRTTRVDFGLKAARATLKLAEGAAQTAVTDVLWEIRDASGGTIWRTGQLEPRVVLAPGAYTVSATLRDQTLTTAFDLQPGEARTVEIGRAP